MPDKICHFLIERNYIPEEDRELYTYAIFNLLFKFAPFLIIIPFCILTHSILPGALCCASFLFLRKYSGGYHCPTPLSCFLCSSFLMLSMIMIGKSLPHYGIFSFLCPIIVLFSLFLAPTKTRNKELNSKEKRVYKKLYFLRCLIFSAFYFFLIILHLSQLSVCLFIAATFVLFFQILH